jgi:hypothetical protein
MVRELWNKSMKEQPALAQQKRIEAVTQEIAVKAPSGAYFYLSSFKRTAPTAEWVKAALMGKVSLAKSATSFGQSLIAIPNGPGRGNYKRKKLTMKARLDRLEKAVKALGGKLD